MTRDGRTRHFKALIQPMFKWQELPCDCGLASRPPPFSLFTMPLQFLSIRELFEQISSSSNPRNRDMTIQMWFQQHAPDIPRQGPGGLALSSCLFPERRADRVYGLRERKLEGIITKAAGLGSGRVSELRRLQDHEKEPTLLLRFNRSWPRRTYHTTISIGDDRASGPPYL